MWPSEASLFLVPCSAQFEYDRKLAFWEHQYGFDFSPLMYVYILHCVHGVDLADCLLLLLQTFSQAALLQ